MTTSSIAIVVFTSTIVQRLSSKKRKKKKRSSKGRCSKSITKFVPWICLDTRRKRSTKSDNIMVPSKPISKTRIRETNKLQILKTFKFLSDYRNSASYGCNSWKKKRFLSNTFSVTRVRTTKSKLISFCHVSKLIVYDRTNLIILVVVAFTKYNNSCTLSWLNKINK